MLTTTDPNLGISDLRLIPERIVAALIALGDQMSRQSWQVGDLTNEAYTLILANREIEGEAHGDLTRMRLYALVGRLVGKSARTVRRYASTAAFYPENVRRQYSELPFSHFEFAAQFRLPVGEAQEPGYIAVLRKSLEYFHDRGFPPSLDSLVHAFQVEMEAHAEAAHFDELPAPILTAQAADEPVELPPGWLPIPSASGAETNSAAGDSATPATAGVPPRPVEPSMPAQLRAAALRVAEEATQILDYLEKMAQMPVYAWARHFQLDVARAAVGMRRIAEQVDLASGVEMVGVYLQVADDSALESVRDDTPNLPPTEAVSPESAEIQSPTHIG